MVALSFWNVNISLRNPFFRKFSKEIKTMGDHIRKKRIELGLLQKHVSSVLKVSEDTITYWENNRAKPMINHMPAIISFLGYNPFLNERETLGGKIKFYRTNHGLSYKTFGKLLKVHGSTISSWESGKSNPKSSIKKKLVMLLNI
jgi:DNA-binding transcriptional regulator YiaG